MRGGSIQRLALVAWAAAFLMFGGALAGMPDCGNGTCDAGEDTCNCIQDCPRTTCAACDCGSSAGVPGRDCFCDADCVMFGDCCDNACAECDVGCCGNGVCDAGEDSCNCLADCPRTTCQPCDCGSGSGTGGRDCFCDDACVGFGDCCSNACEVCGECPPVCGDGTCEGGEDCESCTEDCGTCTGCQTDCGDGECLPDCNESCSSCPADCGGCPGACCHDAKATQICEEISQAACESAFSGTFFGVGTSCDSVDCPDPTGACCYDDLGMTAGSNGPVCEELTSADCAARAGHYGGDGTACGPGACGPGACCLDLQGVLFCFDDGFATACPMASGQFHPGQTCGQVGCPELGACCVGPLGRTAAGIGVDPCVNTTEEICATEWAGTFQGPGTRCHEVSCNPERVDVSTKGSLLILSDIELEWSPTVLAGPGVSLRKDTVVSLLNDYPGDVYVQMYFINGDPELDPVFSSGPAPILIAEGEPGWNWVDCQILLTPDQPVYWSAATGNPVGCQPFTILDPDLGNGPGRPNPEAADGSRVLRGFIVAWAVDAEGREINWNHLSGKATVVDYTNQAAWEYNGWAFQAQLGSNGDPLPDPGFLALDGFEYDSAFDMLLFDFFAAGSQALSSNGNTVSVDTDLTLHVVGADLRQETDGPITTKAHFDIWNMNERKLSNTRRCLTCWDQTLISNYAAPNNMLLVNLQSDKGKARINGLQANECEHNCFRDMNPALANSQTAGFLDDLLGLEFVCSYDAPLLGTAAKVLRFGATGLDYAGSELVGMGFESAYFAYDIVTPPGSLRDEAAERIRQSVEQQKSDRLGRTEKRGGK